MKVHYIVDHPATGRFIARKITNPTERQEKRAYTLLTKFFKERFLGSDTEPIITVERIEDDPSTTGTTV